MPGRAAEPRSIVAHNGARIFGGAERWTVRLLERLQARGHRVRLLCRDEEMRERVEALGVPAEVVRLGGHPMLHHAARLAAVLRRHRPDGLLLTTFKKAWLGGMGARAAGVPRVVVRIGLAGDRPGRRALYRIALGRWVDRVVVNADALRAPVLEDMPALDPARVVTIYNGVERPLPLRPPGALRAELGIPPGAPLVGTVARLDVQKRLDLLFRVVARLGPDVHVLVAGDGPEREALGALADGLGLGGRVHLPGTREDVGDVLAALDVFTVTSRREGMSNAMLEALSAGVPVVSTPVSGATEALEPLADGRRPGLVVEGDEGTFGAALARLLADPLGRAGMGEAGRVRARERFEWEGRVDAWETLLGYDVMAPVDEGSSARESEAGR